MSGSTSSTTSSDAAPDDGGGRDENVRGALRNATIYSLVYGVQRGIGLLMLPVYTTVISPSEYGALGILLSIHAAAYVVFSLALDPAIFRRMFELADDPIARGQFIASVWRFLVVYPLVAALALAAVAWPFVDRGPDVSGLDVLLTLVGAAAMVAATTVPLSVLRAEESMKKFVVVSATNGIGAAAFTAVLVLGFDQGVRGWLVGILVANLSTLVVAMVVLPWPTAIRFQRSLLKVPLRFSLPLMPHYVAHWALQLADRLVIATMVSTVSLGIYTLAANMAATLLFVLNALNQGMMPAYARAGVRTGHDRELRSVVVLQIALVVAITLGGCLVAPPILDVIAPTAYAGAGALVPWIMLGYGFLGLYYIPMNGATLGAGRTGFAWVATALGAATNIVLLVVWVPDHGLKAAAIASAVGYLVLLIAIAVYAHSRPNPVTYDWRRLVPTVLCAVAVFGCATLLAPGSPWARLGVNVAWFMVFSALMVAFRVIRVDLAWIRRFT